MGQRAFCSFSGGKDSCLALYLARQAGFTVDTLITMMDETGQFSRSHGVPLAVMQAQAAALGCTLIAPAATWQNYQNQFVAALHACASEGITTGVFGDIDLQAHKDWEEQVCAQAQVRAYLPLWGKTRSWVVQHVLQLGFKPFVVCVDARYLDNSYCGVDFDAEFIVRLPHAVDIAGENGEFHTFVTNGPGFKAPVPIKALAVLAKPALVNPNNDHPGYWFAQIAAL